ncbi:MAG: alpha/beta hydrolase-fold protein [Bacteroidota bacterium]|nr:alpha/beta hydrolase-fold protein [Bacteroidota bacterium]
MEKIQSILTYTHILSSEFLQRKVIIDLYFPAGKSINDNVSLLLINDGQDLLTMNFQNILEQLYEEKMKPLLCVGIHCGEDRRNEYGTANILNFKGQGTKAALYTQFIFEELLPFIRNEYDILSFAEKSFCGFSLGGLSALDIVWNHAEEFSKVGVFSGSLWWRTLSQNDPEFIEEKHRIMHNEIKTGNYSPWLKFFFETGTLDEFADRNNNGIIDSIDDALSLIDELVKKGYNPETDIRYLELKDGRHDVATWAQAFPEFLKWI